MHSCPANKVVHQWQEGCTIAESDREGALLSSKQSCSVMTGSVYYCRKWQGRCTLVQQTKLFSNDRKGAIYYSRQWQGRCTLVQQTKLFSNDRKCVLLQKVTGKVRSCPANKVVQQWQEQCTRAESAREGVRLSSKQRCSEWQEGCTIAESDREGALLSSKQSCSVMTGRVYYIIADSDREGALLLSKQVVQQWQEECTIAQGRCTLVQQAMLFSSNRKGVRE